MPKGNRPSTRLRSRFQIALARRRRSGRVKIGNTTLFASGYSREVLKEMADAELRLQLATAEQAYSGGQLQGLIEAIELCEMHLPRPRPWPAWVDAGMKHEVSSKGALATPAPSGRSSGGRLANESTRRRARYIDFIRAMSVNALLKEGLTPNAAYARVAKEVRIECNGEIAASSPKVIEQAYKRFYSRFLEAPEEFYPILTPWLMMSLLMEAPVGGVAEAIIKDHLAKRPFGWLASIGHALRSRARK
ncbi:MAG TPA: hypothetical protein VIX73_37665 [Kofleriaceae bacterium]